MAGFSIRFVVSISAIMMTVLFENVNSHSIELTETCKAWGDPHFLTWDGKLYHFQGEGYFDYLKECDRSDGWDIPIVISAKHEYCGSSNLVTCIKEVIVQIKHFDENDGTLKYNFISYGVNGINPIFKNTGTNAIGSHSFNGKDGIINAIIKDNHFEVIFQTGSNENGIILFDFSGITLIIKTNNVLSSLICGLCGTLNGDNNDDFTKCTNNELELDENVNKFGESCCRKDLDLYFIGESDCTPWEPPSVITPSPTISITCNDIAEDICINTYNEYCFECSILNKEISEEYLQGCMYDLCSVSECKNYILSNENNYDIEVLKSMNCLDTTIDFCDTDCKPHTIQPTLSPTEKPKTFCELFNFDESETKSLYRWYNSKLIDHLYTTNPNEPKDRVNWKKEGIMGNLWNNKRLNVLPLYRYYGVNNGKSDHFYTINWNELKGGNGVYKYEGIQGYIMNQHCSNFNQPLYRYYNNVGFDHFYTINWNELKNGANGWKYEGIAGYVAKK